MQSSTLDAWIISIMSCGSDCVEPIGFTTGVRVFPLDGLFVAEVGKKKLLILALFRLDCKESFLEESAFGMGFTNSTLIASGLK